MSYANNNYYLRVFHFEEILTEPVYKCDYLFFFFFLVYTVQRPTGTKRSGCVLRMWCYLFIYLRGVDNGRSTVIWYEMVRTQRREKNIAQVIIKLRVGNIYHLIYFNHFKWHLLIT